MFEILSALAVFGLTLLLVMLRPRGVTKSVAALVGGGLMLLLGRVQPGEAVQVLLDRWDVFLFFLGLMTIAAVADSAGFFDWAAAAAMQLAKGSGLRLFLNVFILGALISTFLSNDATALILNAGSLYPDHPLAAQPAAFHVRLYFYCRYGLLYPAGFQPDKYSDYRGFPASPGFGDFLETPAGGQPGGNRPEHPAFRTHLSQTATPAV